MRKLYYLLLLFLPSASYAQISAIFRDTQLNYILEESALDIDSINYSLDESSLIVIRSSPDSIYEFKFPSEYDSILVGKLYYQYDSFKRPIFSESYYIHPTSNKWVGSTKLKSKYDNNGNQTYLEFYYWDYFLDDWYGSEKYTKTFDNDNRLTSSGIYKWNYNFNTWDFIDSLKYELYYRNDTVVSTISKLDTLKNIWNEITKKEIVSSNYLYVSISYQLDSISFKWKNLSKTEIEYNTGGKKQSQVEFNWDESTNQWIGKTKAEYKYNLNFQETNYILCEWDESKNLWINKNKSETNYDSAGNLILKMNYSWDLLKEQWDENSMKVYAYDENGNQLMYQQSYWILDHWMGSIKVEYEYDESGKRILQTEYGGMNFTDYTWIYKTVFPYDNAGTDFTYMKYEWDSNSHDWINSEISVHFVNQDQNITFDIIYKWDLESDQWILDSKIYYFYKFIETLNNYNIDKEEINVYPNPFTDIINIEVYGNLSDNFAKIFNSDGQLIDNFYIHNGVNSVSFDGLNTGVYYIKINNNSKTKKIFKVNN